MISIPSLALKHSCAMAVASPAQRAGSNYEARVSKWLEAGYSFYPQLVFDTPHGLRIPDGLLFHTLGLIVVEVKTQHTEAAERQLVEYVRVVSAWARRPVFGLEICEVVRWDLLRGSRLLPVDSIEELFICTERLGIMPVSRRRLPRLRKATDTDGLGDSAGATDAPVWAAGSTRDCIGSVQCSSDVVVGEGAGRACED